MTEGPQLTISIKLITEYFEVRIDRSQPQYFISTEVDINAPWRYYISVLGDSYGTLAETHAKWKK